MTGQPCPIPVVQAKKLLADPAVEGVEVSVDNIVAVQNLEKMAKGLQYGFSYTQDSEKLYRVTLLRGESSVLPTQAEADATQGEVLPDMANEGPTVLITGDTLGSGSDDLGRILIKGFIFSLTELSPMPKSVIFLNGGAHLTTEGANTVPDLKALEDKGCEVLTCGTCANFYGLSDKLAVGGITDMMGITTRIAAAVRLISV